MSNHQVPSKLQRRRPSLIIIFLRRRRSQQVTDGRFVVVRDMHLQSVVFIVMANQQVVFFQQSVTPTNFFSPVSLRCTHKTKRKPTTKQTENRQQLSLLTHLETNHQPTTSWIQQSYQDSEEAHHKHSQQLSLTHTQLSSIDHFHLFVRNHRKTKSKSKKANNQTT
mgnify:CR=1 FL=1